MKKETALKRIEKALNECDFINTKEKKKVATKLIYSDYVEFCQDEPFHTDTENLNFAIAIWIEDDGGKHLEDYVNDK